MTLRRRGRLETVCERHVGVMPVRVRVAPLEGVVELLGTGCRAEYTHGRKAILTASHCSGGAVLWAGTH
jgi:hypothetical protein